MKLSNKQKRLLLKIGVLLFILVAFFFVRSEMILPENTGESELVIIVDENNESMDTSPAIAEKLENSVISEDASEDIVSPTEDIDLPLESEEDTELDFESATDEDAIQEGCDAEAVNASLETDSMLSEKIVDVPLTEDSEALIFGDDYYSPEDVSLYLHLYQELPPNYITKAEAQDMGWVASKGNLWEIMEGFCIGGDRFGNREGKLPKVKGRTYYECDVNYDGGRRGGERLIYSNDGLIYYTEDHYETFTLLYGEE